MNKLKNPVLMAVIGAPHGVRGEVRVKTFTADPLSLSDYGPLNSEDGRVFTIAALRTGKTTLVVRFREITSREAAEAANGTQLYVDRSTLPDDLADEEFYHTDLIGLAVRDEADNEIGTVTAVHNFGGGDIIELALPGRRTIMAPFTLAAIPEIAISAGFIRVDSVAAGLVESDADEDAGEGKTGEA